MTATPFSFDWMRSVPPRSEERTLASNCGGLSRMSAAASARRAMKLSRQARRVSA